MLGKHIPHSTQAINKDRLDSKDPRKRKRHIKSVKKEMARQGLFTYYKKLVRCAQACSAEPDEEKRNAFLQSYQAKFNTFHQAKAKIQQTVAHKHQQVFAGKLPFSPKYSNAVNTMLFWEHMLKLAQGCNTSRSKLKHLASLTHIRWKEVHLTTKSQCALKLITAHKAYYKDKPNYPQWRSEFQESLIDALAVEANIEQRIIQNRMKREQKSRDLGWKARLITEKSIKSPVLRAITTNANSDTVELNHQDNMVPVMADSNKFWQQQCEFTVEK